MTAVKDFLARHGLPLGTILLLAVGSAAFSWNIGYEYRWTSDTTDTFYRILRTLPADAPYGGSLLSAIANGLERVFSEEPITAWYQSLFDAYLSAFHLTWGDISKAYKVLVFPLSLLAGCTAYLLIFRITSHRGLALVLAAATVLPMPFSWAGERSGLGPIWTYSRRYFHIAVLPLIALLYFRGTQGNRGSLLGSFTLAGLASNLHASGILLIEGLVLAWLAVGPISPRRTIQATGLLALAFCFSVTAMGSLWARGLETMTQLLLSAIGNVAMAATNIDLLSVGRERVNPELRYLFYPPKIYEHLPGGVMDFCLLSSLLLSLMPLIMRKLRGQEHLPTLAAAAATCLLFVAFEPMWPWACLGLACLLAAGERARTTFVILANYLVIAGFWVAVGGMLLFQTGLALVDGFPVIYNQLRGIRMLGFWVVIWVAALAAPVINGPRLNKGATLLISLSAALVVASTANTFARQYFRIQENDRMEQKLALLELARWAKANTPKESLFAVGYSPFGVIAEREVLRTDKGMRDENFAWLPPKGSPMPWSALDLASAHEATHFFLATADVPDSLRHCIQTANKFYVLLSVRCGLASRNNAIVPIQDASSTRSERAESSQSPEAADD